MLLKETEKLCLNAASSGLNPQPDLTLMKAAELQKAPFAQKWIGSNGSKQQHISSHVKNTVDSNAGADGWILLRLQAERRLGKCPAASCVQSSFSVRQRRNLHAVSGAARTASSDKPRTGPPTVWRNVTSAASVVWWFESGKTAQDCG